jgi:type II secretion system protein G
MRPPTTNPTRRPAARARRGFSLVEVMVVLVVMGILVSIAVPRYDRAVEQSRSDIAAANLRAIWSAQRMYWLENHAYTTDLAGLSTMGLLDPSVAVGNNGYTYAVPIATADSFTANATRCGPTQWSGTLSIDEGGSIMGAIRSAGNRDITPAYQ